MVQMRRTAPPVQDQGFMLRNRSGLSEAQVQLLDTVTNGVFDYPVVEAAMLRLFTRMHLAGRAPPPANAQSSGFGSGSGGRNAGAGRWGGRSGRGPSAWRPAAAAYAASTPRLRPRARSSSSPSSSAASDPTISELPSWPTAPAA